jgi:YidC/Oxa1 family membrane protein insertase
MMDKSQRQLMLLLPLFFVVIVINFPAGLIVYWITTNAWTMGQQYVIRKMVGPALPVPAVGGDGGGDGGKGGSGGGGPPPPDSNGSNGSGLGGGLAGLLRGRSGKPAGSDREPAGVGARSRREVAPPPPPRKKKKRSGRRR